MNIPFGVSAMTYTFARYSLPYALSAIAQQELTEVEIWGSHPHAAVELLDAPYLAYMNNLLSENNLQVSMFTPEQLAAPVSIGSANDHIRDYSVRYFCKAVDAAAALGTKRMLITSGTILNDEDKNKTWRRALDSLHIIADHAQSKDVSLVLEPLARDESPLLYNLQQLREAYQELVSSNTKVMVDLVPMHLNGENLEEYFQEFGDDLTVIHFIDCDGSSYKHLIPGDGVIDFKAIVKTMHHNRFNGSCSLELGETYHQYPEEALQRSLQFLRQLMAEMGSK